MMQYALKLNNYALIWAHYTSKYMEQDKGVGRPDEELIVDYDEVISK